MTNAVPAMCSHNSSTYKSVKLQATDALFLLSSNQQTPASLQTSSKEGNSSKYFTKWLHVTELKDFGAEFLTDLKKKKKKKTD